MPLAISDTIHPTAVIGPDVELADDVQVGPFSILEGRVKVGSGTVIEAHACLSGPIEVGRDNLIGHGAVLGKTPQHRGYNGEPTWLRIGDRNQIREHVTIHRGTAQGRGETTIGDRNMIMVGAHLGHDVKVGNDCTLVNGTLLAGHCELHDGCILSGHSAIQQRVRVGRLAMIGGLGSSSKDVPPFVLLQGYNCVSGLNIVGLRRAGMSAATIDAIRSAFRILYKEGRTQSNAVERIESDYGMVPEVAEFLGFIRTSVTGISPARDRGRVQRMF